jgi:hypothetical protein
MSGTESEISVRSTIQQEDTMDEELTTKQLIRLFGLKRKARAGTITEKDCDELIALLKSFIRSGNDPGRIIMESVEVGRLPGFTEKQRQEIRATLGAAIIRTMEEWDREPENKQIDVVIRKRSGRWGAFRVKSSMKDEPGGREAKHIALMKSGVQAFNALLDAQCDVMDYYIHGIHTIPAKDPDGWSTLAHELINSEYDCFNFPKELRKSLLSVAARKMYDLSVQEDGAWDELLAREKKRKT